LLTEAVRDSGNLYALFCDEVATWDRERFVTVMLDNKHQVIAVDEVSVGSLTASLVHPRLCAAAHNRG
jgi:DNA repair protein RadC